MADYQEINLGTREQQAEKMKEMHDLSSNIVYGAIIECKKCFGRGYSHWNDKLGQYIPCSCVVKAANKVKLDKLRELKPEKEN